MAGKELFEIPQRFRFWSLGLIAVGIISLIIGYIIYGRGDEHHQVRFWSALLHNSVYFLLVVNAAMFFICATTLAWGGWQMSFRRVTEAISASVPIIGILTLVILLALVFGHQHHIYHWLDNEAVAQDKILNGKKGFLNITFFTIWTILTIVGWILLGWKMRRLSKSIDKDPLPNPEAGRRYIFKNTVWAALFIVWFALTVMSTAPWLWLMSIDAHWYSTMYSWYSFASTFVAGIALITLFVVYLKNKGYLDYTNEEHLHDLGKFMFAFSIFWTYLWFSQYMLIWYANIPEETTYYQDRTKGTYSGVFWLSFLLNFLAPLLILMKRDSKRNYTTVTFMAIVILFGHWLDFYQMVYASTLTEHVEMGIYDFGIAAGFVGIIMFVTGKELSKYPLVARNHPFIKESIIHHT